MCFGPWMHRKHGQYRVGMDTLASGCTGNMDALANGFAWTESSCRQAFFGQWMHRKHGHDHRAAWLLWPIGCTGSIDIIIIVRA